jgi:DNA-binding GntR family transcriptional regulator
VQLSDSVFERIKAMIIGRELRPGMKLVDRTLARDLKVSRTPVREALGRLAEIGFIENCERGYQVADADSRQVSDLYHLREILEVSSVQLAATNAQPADIRELRAILQRLQGLQGDHSRRGEEVRVGLTIHHVLARASGNSALQQALERLLDQMLSLIWAEALNESEEAAARQHREHVLLVDLVEAGRGRDAAKVIRAHIHSAKEHVIKIMRAREDFAASARTAVPLQMERKRASERARK